MDDDANENMISGEIRGNTSPSLMSHIKAEASIITVVHNNGTIKTTS